MSCTERRTSPSTSPERQRPRPRPDPDLGPGRVSCNNNLRPSVTPRASRSRHDRLNSAPGRPQESSGLRVPVVSYAECAPDATKTAPDEAALGWGGLQSLPDSAIDGTDSMVSGARPFEGSRVPPATAIRTTRYAAYSSPFAQSSYARLPGRPEAPRTGSATSAVRSPRSRAASSRLTSGDRTLTCAIGGRSPSVGQLGAGDRVLAVCRRVRSSFVLWRLKALDPPHRRQARHIRSRGQRHGARRRHHHGQERQTEGAC